VTDAQFIQIPRHGGALTASDALAHAFTLAMVLLWWAYSTVVPSYQLPGPLPVARRIIGFLTNANEIAHWRTISDRCGC
jgi:ABC-type nitrate/sulfonate/bicarbonate transport system permease component